MNFIFGVNFVNIKPPAVHGHMVIKCDGASIKALCHQFLILP